MASRWHQVLSHWFLDVAHSSLASHDGHVALWQPETGHVVRRLEQPGSGPIWSTVFSSDARVLAAGSGRGMLDLWHARDGHLLLSVRAHKQDLFTCGSNIADSSLLIEAAFSSDSQVLATTGGDGHVCLWRMADPDRLVSFRAEADQARQRRRRLRVLLDPASGDSPDSGTARRGS